MANIPAANTSTILSAAGLCLSYGNQILLDDATIAIHAGEKIGMVGRNGTGKSSCLKILTGQEEANEGTIARQRNLTIGYLPQEFELDDSLSVLENIELGAADIREKVHRYENSAGSEAEMERLLHQIEASDGWHIDSRIQAVMNFLNAPSANRIVSDLSGGEKRRVALCKALAGQPDLLILDEPTNHLDAESILWLEGFLKNFPGTVLFVTHDRYFLDHVTTRILELSGGRFYSHPGNYSAFLLSKADRQQATQSAEGRRQKFLRNELQWVRSGVKARGTKSRHRMDTYYDVANQDAPEQEEDVSLLIPPAPQLGNIVVLAENISKCYGDNALFSALDISIEPGMNIGVVGKNGVGKSTLLKILTGQLQPDQGRVRIGQRTDFNYIDQTRMLLNTDNTVIEEVADGLETVKFGTQMLPVRGYLKRFLFSDERINERVANLSGGEKSRVLLAKILRQGGNFLVLDEPTNDLDLQTLQVLEDALINFDGCSLIVSHDRFFLDRVCDRLIAFEGDGQVVVHVGNYSHYLEKKQAAAKSSPTSKKNTTQTSSRTVTPAVRKLKWKEERELETIEDVILAAEAEAEEIQQKLNTPAFFIDHADKATELVTTLEKKQAHIQQHYQRWEELEKIKRAPLNHLK